MSKVTELIHGGFCIKIQVDELCSLCTIDFPQSMINQTCGSRQHLLLPALMGLDSQKKNKQDHSIATSLRNLKPGPCLYRTQITFPTCPDPHPEDSGDDNGDDLSTAHKEPDTGLMPYTSLLTVNPHIVFQQGGYQYYPA